MSSQSQLERAEKKRKLQEAIVAADFTSTVASKEAQRARLEVLRRSKQELEEIIACDQPERLEAENKQIAATNRIVARLQEEVATATGAIILSCDRPVH